MIHGSKKIKKIKTQAEIKQEQQLSNKINSKLSDFFLIRKKTFTDQQIPKYIEFTSLLMQLCSDIPTIFNFRRELLERALSMSEKDINKKQQYLTNQIKIVTKLIQQDPKSYTLWSFRQWLVQNIYKINPLIVKQEKKLCKLLLLKDEKNFHVWNYRNWVNSVQFNIDQQLAFTEQKIKSNPFNFSPYHFRSKYLPLKYQPLLNQPQTPQSIKKELLKYGMTKQVFDSELQSIKTAIYLNPNEQAPWIYYRWLLKRLIPVIVVSVIQAKTQNKIRLMLNQRVKNLSHCLLKQIKVTGQPILSNEWDLECDGQIKFNNECLVETEAISKHFLGYLTQQNVVERQEIKSIFSQQQQFLRQILQEQQQCRFGWLQLLQILKNQLYLTCSQQEWKRIAQSGQKIFSNLEFEMKTKNYIQRLKQYWFRIGHIENLTEEQKYLIK